MSPLSMCVCVCMITSVTNPYKSWFKVHFYEFSHKLLNMYLMEYSTVLFCSVHEINTYTRIIMKRDLSFSHWT